MRIEITGAIGAGKSSLAKLLLDHGYEVVFEEFKANPFWRAFYTNPDKYNFETEITFVLQHYHELKRKLEEANEIVAADFSFTQDLAYAVMGLNKTQLQIFRSIYNYIIKELGEPKLIIFMKCSSEGLLKRIKLRGREEEALIDDNFLTGLSMFIKKEVENKRKSKKSISLLEIDTEEFNIIHNSSHQHHVLNLIKELLT